MKTAIGPGLASDLLLRRYVLTLVQGNTHMNRLPGVFMYRNIRIIGVSICILKNSLYFRSASGVRGKRLGDNQRRGLHAVRQRCEYMNYHYPQGDTMSGLINSRLERERLYEQGSRRHSSFQSSDCTLVSYVVVLGVDDVFLPRVILYG